MKFSQRVSLLWFFLCLFSSPLIAQVSVIGDLSQERVVAPGESYDGVILVRNDTNEPQETKIYQTEPTTTALPARPPAPTPHG
jgi:hypothetical protein